MSRKVCIIGGATTPFDYGPTGFESIEGGAAECVKETQQDVPEFSLRDLDLMIYSHFSVHFSHQLAPEWIIHVENGGNTGGSALYAATLAVMSGHHDVVGIVGWETMDTVTQSQGSEFIAMASDIRYEKKTLRRLQRKTRIMRWITRRPNGTATIISISRSTMS